MLVKDHVDQPVNYTTVDATQIVRFDALAEKWWKPDGIFRVSHGFNDARRVYIEACIARKFERDLTWNRALNRIRVLDVGCGVGLVSEPLACLGADLVGVDATSRNIEIAKRHARQTDVEINYRHGTVDSAVSADELFDVVLNLEVIEHVDDSQKLIADCTARLKAGGILIVATRNRDLCAWALAIIGAEYVLRLLPMGTHDWWRFLKPHEIEAMLACSGCKSEGIVGVAMNPVSCEWKITADAAVNYMMVAEKTRPSHAFRKHVS